MERIAEASPRFKARMAGVFQLLEALTATFGQVIVRDRLVVAGNAAATAANILGHERLFWLGFASSLVGVAFHIAWALLMYELLKPVNRSLSLLAAFVILVGCAIQAFTSLLYLAPLLILQGGSSLSAFTPEQLQALALMFLKLNAYAFNIEVDLPASNSGSAVSDQWLGFCDLSVPAARILSVPALHRRRLRPRGNTTGAMAHRDGCERSTMAGAGQRRSGSRMKAAIYSRYGPPDVVQIADVEKPVPPQCVQSCTGFFVSHNRGQPGLGGDRTAR